MIYSETNINDIEHQSDNTLQYRIPAYLASPNHCLHCDSDNITCGHFEAGHNEAWSPVTCQDCGKQWMDCYTLTSVTIDE